MRVAIAGTGYIAHYHARAVRAAGGEVVSAFGRDRERAEAFAKLYGASHVLQSLDDVPTAGAPDAVVIALPNSLHAPLAIDCLDAGLHVLIDKPMALDGPQARRIKERAVRADRRLLIGHMWRYDEQAIWLRDTVRAGTLGEIVKTKSYGIHVGWGPSGWFVDPELAGGGALIDMGVHAIDTTRFLLGDPRPLKVYAQIGTRFGDYEVDDFGIIVIDWEGGATSIIESGWWNPHMDGAEASTQIFGTRGYGRLFPNELRVREGDEWVSSTPDFPPRAEHCDQSIYDAQMVGFFDAIRTGEDPLASADVGIVVMDICDAAYRSAASGEAVTIEGR
jgi:predicted dehydrogenase